MSRARQDLVAAVGDASQAYQRSTHALDDAVADALDLNQTDLPDPLARTLEQMADRIHVLEAEIERLKKAADVPADAPAD